MKAIGHTDTWITPKYITDALGEFDLDPCAHTDMPWSHAKKEYTVNDDGLAQEWKGRVWLNPPFNRYKKEAWIEKMKDHKNGIMLIPATMETSIFQKHVWDDAKGILFLDHRPYFCKADGNKGSTNSGQTMCLIAYDEFNFDALVRSKLGLVMVTYK